MADVSNLRANINGVFETFGVKDKIARENTENLSNALFAAQIVDSASGAIASFPDGADDIPVRSLSVDLEPIQDLHGYDSPWPAGGGKNLVDIPFATVLFQSVLCSVDLSAGQYTLSATCTNNTTISGYLSLRLSSVAKGAITIASGDSSVRKSMTFTLTEDGQYDVVGSGAASGYNFTVANVQLEEGSTATNYAPYENICPISGRESVTVERTGKNLFDGVWESGSIVNKTGENVSDSACIRCKNYIPCKNGQSIYMGWDTTASGSVYMLVMTYGADGSYKRYTGARTRPYTLKLNDDEHFIKFFLYKRTEQLVNPYIVYGSTATAYEPYNGQSVTVQLGQTVYGGTLDVVSGKLTVDRAMVDLGTLNWNRVIQSGQQVFTSNLPDALVPASSSEATTAVCSALKTVSTNKLLTSENACIGIGRYLSNVANLNAKLNSVSTKEDFKAAMSGIQLCYPLATPLEITLDPATLSTLKGDNNVWSDGDSVTVDYVADPKLYIDSLTEPDSDMVADTNIVSGKYFTINNVLYLATANIANGAAIVPGTNCTKTNLAEALNAINA